MGIVFVASNCTRVLTLARWLYTFGETPVVFAFGADAPETLHRIPAVSLAMPFDPTDAARSEKWYEIDTYARRSHPSMVIADIETVDICAGAGAVRVLLVEPEFSKQHPARCRQYARTFGEVVVLDRYPKDIAKSLHDIARAHSLAPSALRPVKPPRLTSARITGNSMNRLLVRFDDVTELEDVVVTIMCCCLENGLCLSLDVIPYLCRFNGADLNALGAVADRVEVAQHGFCHLPRMSDTGRRTEFLCGSDAVTPLQRGKAAIDRRFPEHFRGGYSAPYDFMAPGVAEAWQHLGGRYLSTMSRLPLDLPLPHARLATDPWDWAHSRPLPFDEVMASLDRSAIERGVSGLVLHPAPLRSGQELERTREMLRIVARRGFTHALISDVTS